MFNLTSTLKKKKKILSCLLKWRSMNRYLGTLESPSYPYNNNNTWISNVWGHVKNLKKRLITCDCECVNNLFNLNSIILQNVFQAIIFNCGSTNQYFDTLQSPRYSPKWLFCFGGLMKDFSWSPWVWKTSFTSNCHTWVTCRHKWITHFTDKSFFFSMNIKMSL